MEFEISLNDLVFHAFHGVYEEERKLGNEFRVTLSVRILCIPDHKLDDLNNTISYAELYEIVEKEMKTPRNLIETLALDIATNIKERYPAVLSGNITITKVHPPIEGMTGSASVSLYF